MRTDCLFIKIKNAFHELLCVVNTDPIQSNKKPDSIRLFFDFMLVFLVTHALDMMGHESNKNLKAKTQQTISLQLHHGVVAS